jgi:hypothetical protein
MMSEPTVWQTPQDAYGDDPASLLRFAELYFSDGVRSGIWPHVDLMNRGIRAGDLEALRLGVHEQRLPYGCSRLSRASKAGLWRGRSCF